MKGGREGEKGKEEGRKEEGGKGGERGEKRGDKEWSGLTFENSWQVHSQLPLPSG